MTLQHSRPGAHHQRKGRSQGARSKHAPQLPVVYETSAGGVVIRRMRGQLYVALLKTRHTRGVVWVLPKGHIEHAQGETHERAAVREVQEELGITRIRTLRKLGTVRWQFLGTLDRRTDAAGHAHAVRDKRRPLGGNNGAPVRVIKTVHHYLMEGLSEKLHPQKEEGFLEARWVPYREALKLITYPTDRTSLMKVGNPKRLNLP